MLTKKDLQEIGKVFDERLEQKLDEKLEQKLEDKLEQKLKPIKKDLSYLRKTLDLAIKNYDEREVKLNRRVTRIEDHLNLH